MGDVIARTGFGAERFGTMFSSVGRGDLPSEMWSLGGLWGLIVLEVNQPRLLQ